jgi:FkbM family methyltransferase|tara:strand:- start:832 stop:1614 length:783 start_codon:yes stop_codon:yes gene_type:complete
MSLEEFKKRIKQKEQVLYLTIEDEISNEKIIYNVKNQTTLWRSQSLYTKEPITIKWIRSFKKNSVFFDVGANVGMYSIFSAKVSKVKVYSFEPESNNFQILMENIISNNLVGQVKAFPIAIGEKSDFTSLYLNDFIIGSSHHMIDNPLDHNLQKKEFKINQGVFKTSLDKIVSEWGFPMPKYLKIDVDGIENLIIKNSKSILKNKNLTSVLIEINRNREEDLEIITILEENGFKYDHQQVKDATRKSGTHEGYAEYLFYK